MLKSVNGNTMCKRPLHCKTKSPIPLSPGSCFYDHTFVFVDIAKVQIRVGF